MAPSKMKARGKASIKTEAEAIAATSSTTPKTSLPPESSNPPKLFILPKDICAEARIISLPNPRTSTESRYLYCPLKGFYEFTKIAAPKTTPRSWLLAPESERCEKRRTRDEDGDAKFKANAGYVTKSADLFIATPIDPLFLVLPCLSPAPRTKSSEGKPLFLSPEDHFDNLISTTPHLRTLLHQHHSLLPLLTSRLSAACDSASAGPDEIMYRLSQPKLLALLLSKATALVEAGLPASMEEKLIRKALEVPMPSLKRGEAVIETGQAEDEEVGTSTPSTEAESANSQTTVSSVDTAASSVPDASIAGTSFSSLVEVPPAPPPATPIDAPEGIPHLLRIQTIFNYILQSYIPPHLSASLTTLLLSSPPTSTSPTISFAPLDAHLAHLSGLRAAAQQSRSFSDFSRKRAFDDEEEAEGGETRAEKKRRKDEEEKRKKAGESRGVRELKKVNVSGMKKMSDFFAKKTG